MDEFDRENNFREKNEAIEEIKRLKVRLRRAFTLTKKFRFRKKGLRYFKAVAWTI